MLDSNLVGGLYDTIGHQLHEFPALQALRSPTIFRSKPIVPNSSGKVVAKSGAVNDSKLGIIHYSERDRPRVRTITRSCSQPPHRENGSLSEMSVAPAAVHPQH
jgi:hypothetical protein